MHKVELLAPAGNLEKLKMAIIYGADAVYIGGKSYSLRASSDNFSFEDMVEGIRFVHAHQKKIYLTLNIIAHNRDMQGLVTYIEKIASLGFDAIIVADPGIFNVVKRLLPAMPLHISTQASNTNYESVAFWADQGVSRVVLARELSLEEIREINERMDGRVELECFVHGSMCISYSGRCLLSTYMTGRDANQGQCAHPCRWQYHVVEEKRPGEYYPVIEDERGTYIYNSKDLCMIAHLPQMIAAGVKSLKIEGRMKSAYYVATVVGAYRKALDHYDENPQTYGVQAELIEEVSKASHREFSTGFYLGTPGAHDRIFHTGSYVRSYDFIGLVIDYDPTTKMATIEQRNRMQQGDEMEVVVPGELFFRQSIRRMENMDGELIFEAPHPQMRLKMEMEKPVLPFSILRRKQSQAHQV